MNIGKISTGACKALHSLTDTKAFQNSAQRIRSSINEYKSNCPANNELDLLKLCTKVGIETPKAYLGALAEKVSNIFH